MKWVLIFVIGVALFVAYSCMLWRDGYNDGMLEERRKRIRSFTFYNKHIQATRDELDLLWADLNDIKDRMPACTKPNAFEDNVISARMLNDDFEPKTTVEEAEE